MAVPEVVRRYGPDAGFGTFWAVFGAYWLTRGDEKFVGMAALLLAAGFLARAVFSESRRAFWVIWAVVAVGAVATLVLGLRSGG